MQRYQCGATIAALSLIGGVCGLGAMIQKVLMEINRVSDEKAKDPASNAFIFWKNGQVELIVSGY